MPCLWTYLRHPFWHFLQQSWWVAIVRWLWQQSNWTMALQPKDARYMPLTIRPPWQRSKLSSLVCKVLYFKIIYFFLIDNFLKHTVYSFLSPNSSQILPNSPPTKFQALSFSLSLENEQQTKETNKSEIKKKIIRNTQKQNP